MDSTDALGLPKAAHADPGAAPAGTPAEYPEMAAPELTDGDLAALYRRHALGLVRLAVVMLGHQAAAEDVVQEAFLGLYRRRGSLTDPSRALAYLRSSVLNGCRTAVHRHHRQGAAAARAAAGTAVPLDSADAWALLAEEHREVLAAIKRLPDRQREAIVLRFYLDMSEEEVARTMGISRGTVKSATHRGMAALARLLKEEGFQ